MLLGTRRVGSFFQVRVSYTRDCERPVTDRHEDFSFSVWLAAMR